MAFLSGLVRLLVLILNAGLLIVGLVIVVSVVLLVFVAAPTFLIGYIATKILYWLYTRLVISVRPDSYSRLHRWKPGRNLIILAVIGVLVWGGMAFAVNRYGDNYLSFTYQMICSTVDWVAPVTAERAIQAATGSQANTQAPAAPGQSDQGTTVSEQRRCDVLITAWIPWLGKPSLRTLAIGLILLLVVLTRWKRITDQARRTAIVERPDAPLVQARN